MCRPTLLHGPYCTEPGAPARVPASGSGTLFVDGALEESACRGEDLLRVRRGEDLGPVPAGARLSYRWSADGSWLRALGYIEPSSDTLADDGVEATH